MPFGAPHPILAKKGSKMDISPEVGQAADMWMHQAVLDLPLNPLISDVLELMVKSYQHGRADQKAYDQAKRTNYDERSLIR